MVEKRTEINIENGLEKGEVINLVDKWRFDLGFSVKEINGKKPWGAYWSIPDWQTEQFIYHFFPKMLQDMETLSQKLSPKFLLVEPNQKLSWQYHNRRAENWRVVAGTVGIKVSDTDIEPERVEKYKAGESISFDRGTRHRLIGLDGWGLVAEIWKHTDLNEPSNEKDIERLQDDFEGVRVD